MIESILKSLDREQQKIILSEDEKIFVIAGPGGGKTKTLISKIIQSFAKIPEENILALTFTNKAAREIKNKINKLINRQIKTPILTFHSLGLLIIKENLEIINFNSNFKIIDKNESKKILKEIIESIGLEKNNVDKISNFISKHKNNLKEPIDFLNRSNGSNFLNEQFIQLWEKYEIKKVELNALDFDDLLTKSLKILKNKNIAKYYQNRFKFILIDEFQDTNLVQLEIIKKIFNTNQKIYFTGDIDQSIYGWRGALISNSLKLEENFKNLKIFILSTNYRSTQNIIKLADKIIVRNTERIPKDPSKTPNSQGEKILLAEFFNEEEEGNYIAKKIKAIHQKNPEKTTAVLYRTNFQSRILENCFIENNLQYQILGTKFFDRKEVKDVLAYLSYLIKKNKIDFKRIINFPTRGLGQISIEKILNQIPLKGKQLKNYNDFLNLIQELKNNFTNKNCSEIIDLLIKKLNLKEILEEEKFFNVLELKNIAEKYNHLESEAGLELMIEESALFLDQRENLEKNISNIKLMTIHAAKGLEFDNVFIVGLEKKLFPLESSDLEEERRLFYVALTRAKQNATISYNQSRRVNGQRELRESSIFIKEIENEDEIIKNNIIIF